MTGEEARLILDKCGIVPNADFHSLDSFRVNFLLDCAIIYKYRKPKDANGSLTRYFYNMLQRKAYNH